MGETKARSNLYLGITASIIGNGVTQALAVLVPETPSWLRLTVHLGLAVLFVVLAWPMLRALKYGGAQDAAVREAWTASRRECIEAAAEDLLRLWAGGAGGQPTGDRQVAYDLFVSHAEHGGWLGLDRPSATRAVLGRAQQVIAEHYGGKHAARDRAGRALADET